MKKTPCLSALLAALALSACHNGAVDYPKLLPTQQILAEPTLPEHSGEARARPGQHAGRDGRPRRSTAPQGRGPERTGH